MYLSHEGHSAPWAVIGIHRVRGSSLSPMASAPRTPNELAALRREYGDAGLDDPDLAPDPIAMFRPVDARRGRRGAARAQRDGGRHGVAGGPPVVADGAAQGRRRARLRLLHQLRLPQGRGTSRPTPPSRCCSPGTTCSARCGSRARADAGLRRRRARRTSPPGRAAPSSAPGPRRSREEVASRAELRGGVRRGRASGSPASDVPLPPHWGGFRVRPDLVEFWQGRRGRMHDRLVYRRDGDGWTTARLAP